MSLVSLAHSGCCGTIGMQSKIMSGAATTLVLSHSAVGSGILRTFGCFFWKHLRNGNRRSTSAMADPCLFGRHKFGFLINPQASCRALLAVRVGVIQENSGQWGIVGLRICALEAHASRTRGNITYYCFLILKFLFIIELLARGKPCLNTSLLKEPQ